MSQTHKGDRKKSGFEVEDHATILKNNIRELSLARNFGLKVRESRTPRNFAQWSEVSRERWKEQERQRMERLKWLDEQFLVKARDWIDDDLRRMMHGISAANSIKNPSNMAEADERRIQQDKLREIIRTFTDDPLALKLVDVLLEESRLDVSYMTDAEYARSMETKFDRVAYRAAHYPKRGEKYLNKGMNVGDQFSQTAGIVYPYRVDSLAKNVLGSPDFKRYMDDSADIDSDLQRLKDRGAAIDAEADKLGMHTNTRKTCICRIDKGFTWLQRNMRLRDDGTVSVRIKSEAVTRIKRRIRKLEDKVKDGRMPLSDLTNMVKSWTYSRREEMSYPQLRSIELTVLSIYGRKAYEQVYDHSERWKAT